MAERDGASKVAPVTGAGRGIALRPASDGLDVAVDDVGADGGIRLS